MADQKLVAIHHIPFLVEKFSYKTDETCNFLKKLALRYILTIILKKMVLWHYLFTF